MRHVYDLRQSGRLPLLQSARIVAANKLTGDYQWQNKTDLENQQHRPTPIRRINCRAAKTMLVKQRKICNQPQVLSPKSTAEKRSRPGATPAAKRNKPGAMPRAACGRSRKTQSNTSVKIQQKQYSRRSELDSCWV